MHARHATLLAGIALLLIGGFLLWPGRREAEGRQEAGPDAVGVSAEVPPPPPANEVRRIDIAPNDTFGELMKAAGVSDADIAGVYDAAREAYDLASIRAGRGIDLVFAPNDPRAVELIYDIDGEEELRVVREGEAWTAAKAAIAYDVRLRTVEGTIESSLYAAAKAQGLDERAVIALADVFQWTIDFSQDARVGDTFRFIYEERYRDGRYVMPGRVFAAKYVNGGQELFGFWFENAKGEEGYYDDKGGSLRKMFLKAPVAFKYISSGFTTGLRYVSAFNTSTGHRAIDYAAAAGTPIRVTADGTVVTAGWNGPYGNFVSVRHNGTFTTNYAHMSKIAVKRGQRVSQGQTIGYVGSTGFSTGPHLHYEMVKNGVKINPLREDFPGTDPVQEADKSAFEAVVAEWKPKL